MTVKPIEQDVEARLLLERIHVLDEEVDHLKKENEQLRTSTESIFAIMNVTCCLSDRHKSVSTAQQVLDYAVDLFTLADAGLITIYDESSGYDEVIATSNHDPTIYVNLHMRANEGATGWSYAHGEPRIWIGEAESLSCLDGVTASYREALLYEQQKPGMLASSLLCCPMISKGKVIGAIQLEHYGDNRQFSESEMRLLMNLVATPLAIAFDNFELADQMKEKNDEIRRLLRRTITSQEEERTRIACDLHDDISQTLAGLHIALKNLETFLKKHSENDEMVSYLQELDESVQRTIETTQNLSFNLRPTILNDLGLVSALEWYLESYVANANLSTFFEVADIAENEIEPWAATTLFRVAQEALSNVIRHAKATNVYVCLTATPSDITLTISDDGCGFVQKDGKGAIDPAYLGLRGMWERLSMVGGSFAVFSQLGEGTKVSAIVPKIGGGQT